MKKLFGASLFLAFCATASAHEAHVHGVARMNLAVEGQKVDIELDSPLANFLSFEHAPKTDAQKRELRAMANTLRKAETLFILPADAGCRLEKVAMESDATSDELPTPKPAKHAGHAEGKHEHHDGHHSEHHEKHAHDAHDNHGDHDAHGDIALKIAFGCNKPEKLNGVTVELFRAFPNLRRLEVQMLTPKGQGAAELVPEANRLRW